MGAPNQEVQKAEIFRRWGTTDEDYPLGFSELEKRRRCENLPKAAARLWLGTTNGVGKNTVAVAATSGVAMRRRHHSSIP